MSAGKDDLLIVTLKNINDKVDKLDTKFDSMMEVQNQTSIVHAQNTVVLEEHERRSTSNERRVDLLESRQNKIEKKADRLHGFFFYSGAILAIFGGIITIFHDSVDTILSLFRHK